MDKKHPSYRKLLIDTDIDLYFGKTHINLNPNVIEQVMKFFIGDDYLNPHNIADLEKLEQSQLIQQV